MIPIVLPLASTAVLAFGLLRRYTYFIGMKAHKNEAGHVVYSDQSSDPGIVYQLFRLDHIVRDLMDPYPRLRDRYTAVAQSTEAYTLDKTVIYLCFEQVDSFNTLVFVLLHEVAHMLGDDVGHGDAFKKRFADVLRTAASRGHYVVTDYRSMPTRYCHLTITATPLA